MRIVTLSLLLILAGSAAAGDTIRATTAAGLTASALTSVGADAWATFPSSYRGSWVEFTLKCVTEPGSGGSRPTLVVMKGTTQVGTATWTYANQEVSYLVDLGSEGTLQVTWAPPSKVLKQLKALYPS